MSHPAKLEGEHTYPSIAHARKTLEWADHWARIANSPLKHQDDSDSWHERQNRLTAARDAVKLRLKGTMELNLAKRAIKKKANNGTESTE